VSERNSYKMRFETRDSTDQHAQGDAGRERSCENLHLIELVLVAVVGEPPACFVLLLFENPLDLVQLSVCKPLQL
jgi:hypothetical protein